MLVKRFYRFIRNEFKLRDQLLIAIILHCLFAIVAGALLFLIPDLTLTGELIMAVAQTIAEWTGLVLLLLNGTIMKSKYWKYIVAGVVIIVVAMLFKILYWSGATGIFSLGILIIEVVYTIRFVNQRYTSISGWFKYGWICSWCAVTFGIMINRISDLFMLIPAVLFWLTLNFFLIEKMSVARKYKGVDIYLLLCSTGQARWHAVASRLFPGR